MALITRISRLFQADLHAVLDRIEEPDALLRQAVREMEDECERDERHVRALRLEHSQVAARQTDVGRALREVEEALDVCFASDQADLARAHIKKKLEAERFRNVLARRCENLERTLTDLDARLDENRTRLDGMRQKAELLAEEEGAAPEDRWATPDFSVRDEDVEVAFLREKQRRRRS